MKNLSLLFFFICSIVSISAQNKNTLAKSDSLFAKGVELYNIKKYREAIPLFEESDSIDKIELDSLSNRRDYSSMWLSSCYYKLGEIDKAKNIYEDYMIRPVDRRLTIKSDSLSNLVTQLSDHDLDSTIQLLFTIAKLEERAIGADHPSYGNTLLSLANCLSMTGQFDKALNILERNENIVRTCYGVQSYKYANTLSTKGFIFHMMATEESLLKALEVRKQAYEIFNKFHMQNELQMEAYYLASEYLSLSEMANDDMVAIQHLKNGLKILPFAGKSQEAIELNGTLLYKVGQKCLSIDINNNFTRSNPDESIRLNTEAITYFSEALKFGASCNLSIATAYDRLSYVYNQNGQISSAIECGEKCLAILSAIPDVDIKTLSYPLLNLANLYLSLRLPAKAFDLFQRTSSLMDVSDKNVSEELLNLNITGASVSIALSKITDARRYIEAASNYANLLYKKSSIEFAGFLTARARLYKDLNEELLCITDLNELYALVANVYPNNKQALISPLHNILDAKIHFGIPSWENTYTELLSILNGLDSPNPLMISSIYGMAAKMYSKISEYEKAKAAINNAIEFYTPISSVNLQNLIALKNIKIDILLKCSEFEECIALCENVLSSPNCNLHYKEKIYCAQAVLSYKMGNIDGAISKLQDAIDIRLSKLGTTEESSIYDLLLAQAAYYEKKKDYSKASELRKQVVDITKDSYGEDSEYFLNALVNFESTPFTGNGSRLREAQLMLLDNQLRVHGEKSLAYYLCLLKTAKVYLNLGLFEDGIKFGQLAVDGMCETLGEQSEDVQSAMITLASLYNKVGDFENSILYLEKAFKYTQDFHPNAKMRLYNALSQIVGSYEDQSDFGSMIYNADQLINQTLIGFGENSYNHLYALLLKNSAILKLGDYPVLENSCTDLVNRAEKHLRGEQRAYIISQAYNMLMIALSNLNKDNEAVAIGNKLINNFNTKDLGIIYHNLSYVYFKAGDKENAIKASQKALDYINSSESIETKALSYIKQGHIRSLLGDLNEGLKLMEHGLEIRDSIYNGKGYYVALGLLDLVKVYAAIYNVDERNNYALRLSNVARDYILKSFLTLPTNSRQAYWNQYSTFFLSDFQSYASETPSENMIKMAYDNALFGKSLLLSTELKISDIIDKKDNPELKDKYTKYRQNIALLDYIRLADPSKILVTVDSIEAVTRQLEYEIIKECGDFTSELNTHWEDVRNALNPDEVAIEFSAIGDNSNKILALILKHDYSSPHYLILNNVDADFWNNDQAALTKSLWAPIADEIGSAKVLYFSPSGSLHNIPIESLPDFDNPSNLINNRWDIRRLSSTRMLVERNAGDKVNHAILYGGLIYDAGIDILADDVNKYPIKQTRSFLAKNEIDSIGYRYGVENLPYTQEEIDFIGAELDKRKIKKSVFAKLNGTEGSFKSLSGSKIGLLHIATHGFYWTEKEARRNSNLQFLRLNDNSSIQNFEDKALTRSGLFFTGANNVLMGKSLPENSEDGVLTAKEIANLNLNQLDFVVLSACQTGLGDITSDGVFGLQRGFKKAGAKSLLMSLWPVNDRATQMLMSKFYELFLSGKSKSESLILAQKYVREYEEEVDVFDNSNMTASQRRKSQRQGDTQVASTEIIRPFENPKYWAAFILLDALN